MPAYIARNAMSGNAADPCGDFLDRRHQRKRQQHGPADAVAELRAGLAVGADPRRIIVGCAGDQSRSERLQRIAEAKRPRRLVPGSLLRMIGGRTGAMLRIGFGSIGHTGSSRTDNGPEGIWFPDWNLLQGRSAGHAEPAYVARGVSMTVATPGSRMRN